jgi:hypothetical protein
MELEGLGHVVESPTKELKEVSNGNSSCDKNQSTHINLEIPRLGVNERAKLSRGALAP